MKNLLLPICLAAAIPAWILAAEEATKPAAIQGQVESACTENELLGDAWTDPRNPIVRIFDGQRLDLWSLRAVSDPAPPAVADEAWVRNPVDRFVLARLEAQGTRPAPAADRRTLARRLHFDLTGLVPTPEEVAVFLNDDSPLAYEHLVERLLQSPRYGEHLARLWLDVARYSDSNGFDWDEFRPQAWRFRDYVIRSFNADKPFDRFIREQLAGDELLAGEPETRTEQDGLIATGYLRIGPQDNSAPLFDEQGRARAELMFDLVETTGGAFLGLNLSCCRCHDHKNDPISQADYFRMRAFFEPVAYADESSLDLAPEQAAIRAHNESVERELNPVREKRDQLRVGVKDRLREERIAALNDGQAGLWRAAQAKEPDGELKSKFEELKKSLEPSDKEIKAAMDELEKAMFEELADRIESLEASKRKFTHGLLMTDSTEPPPATRILFQGDYKSEREPVEPGFLSALDPNPARLEEPINSKTTGRRLTLANWIASPDNPLTARVLVNRVWQACFGRGLVATPNDFGLAGGRPTHPELLDWLAREFMAQGWSVKKLHYLIATSATYRQASAEDVPASGDLLRGHNLRRLTAEQLRDSLLAVSGLLLDDPGGPPVWPELPAEILQANPAFLDDNAAKTKGWYPSPSGERNVRGIYLVQKRTVRLPFMETFDQPENSVSCPRRDTSIVAPQALSLLNGPLAVRAARALAERVRREAGTKPDDQMDRLFQLVLQRPPALEEREASRTFLNSRSLAELSRAMLNVNEFIFVD